MEQALTSDISSTAPRLRVAVVIGTRPEAIKLAPVILAARARPAQFEVQVIRTGQHRELVDRAMHEFGLCADIDLDLMTPNQSLAHVLSASVSGLFERFRIDPPDWVLVQGDTTTTFAGALAAFYNQVRVGHVEAGLRTGDRRLPFPEEANRTLTARLADLHFAPTEQARRNLLAEGLPAAAILLTGNTVIDILLHTLGRTSLAAERRAPAAEGAAGYVLVTVHRRENQGPPLMRICDALIALLDRHPALNAWLPMHPSPNVRDTVIARLGRHPRIRLTEPLGYVDFVSALDGATLVLTDSGGVQEECAALGKPVLVMRDDTERPEAVDAGVALLVGTDSQRIVEVASRLLGDPEATLRMARPSAAFGDGHASARILDALLDAERTKPAERPRLNRG
jgi:UDP-N-acetylglucosamine 2-epimerase (non-hydrolysing)